MDEAWQYDLLMLSKTTVQLPTAHRDTSSPQTRWRVREHVCTLVRGYDFRHGQIVRSKDVSVVLPIVHVLLLGDRMDSAPPRTSTPAQGNAVAISTMHAPPALLP